MTYNSSRFYEFANVTQPGEYLTVVNDISGGNLSLIILGMTFLLVYFYAARFSITKRFIIGTGSLLFVAPILFFAGWISWTWMSSVFAMFIISLAAHQFLKIQ